METYLDSDDMDYYDDNTSYLEDNHVNSNGSSDAMPIGHSPASAASTRSNKKSPRNNTQNRNGNNDKILDRKKSRNSYNPLKKPKRTPKATEIGEEQPNLVLGIDHQKEPASAEDKTLTLVSQNVESYSRQRMRALQMSLRNFSNVDRRVNTRELNQACQENGIQLTSRVMQILLQKFEDQRGIDIEKLYQYLSEAHSKSGRDSVMAMHARNDLALHHDTNQEEKDADLLRRLEELLVKDKTFFDIDTLREAFQQKDKQKTGKITNDEVLDIVAMKQQPLYGALLKALVKRCDLDKNNVASWPEFLSFLEKAQKNAWEKYPEMATIPEQVRSKTPIVPDPVDSLSQHTKSKLMNRLLKKSALNKAEKQKKEGKAKTETKIEEKHVEEENTCMKVVLNTEHNNNIEEQTKIEDKIEERDETENQDKPEEQEEIKEKETNEPSGRKKENAALDESFAVNVPQQLTDEKAESSTEINTNISTEVEPKPVPETKIEIKTNNDVQNENDKDGKSEKNIPKDEEENENDEKSENSTETNEDEKETTDHKPTKDSGGEQGDFLVLVKNGNTIKFPKPTGYDRQTPRLEPPEERLKIDWVYGYRGNDCRNNIHILSSGELVYFISNIVVLYNREGHKQRHYREHTEYIKCIALHPDGILVATGQVCSKHRPENKPHIRIWRTDTLQTTLILNHFEKSVMCLAFSKTQDILAAVDNTQDKRLTIWNTSTGELLVETEVNTELICDVSFNQKYPELLVTSGKEHLQWWKIYAESRILQPVAQPQYDNYLRAKYVIFLAHNENGDLFTGDSNGTIYVWADGGNKITNFIKHAHDGPVFVVLPYKNYILSGGRDGIVYCWVCNKNMDNIGELQIPRSEGGIRMLQLQGDTLIMGTTMNSMLSAQLSSKPSSPMSEIQLDPVPITQGHYDDLRGLVVMHESQLGGDFLTAGVDGVVCWFNTERRDPVCKLMLKGMQFTCADSSYDGTSVVLGTRNGHLVILRIEGESSSEVFNKKITKDRIDCVRYSPDYTLIAVGSHDYAIHMYQLKPNDDGQLGWQLKGKCMGHHQPVVDIDFSADLYSDHFLLRSCSNKPEILFWNSQNLEQADNIDVQGVTWMTEKCKLTQSSIGIWWSKIDQDGEINCTDVYSDSNLIVMGDSCGNVCLYRYPCNRNGAFCHMYHSHASVYNVCFSHDGKYVISVGGKDSCIIQWKIV